MSDGYRILVVEDNDFVRMQIVKYLNDAGMETIEASDGDAALDKIIADRGIDLAIVDVRMEPMGGFDFIRAIRGRDIETPVILVTGDQTPDLLERAGQCGVSAVLMKPVEKDRLVKTVERTIVSSKRLV
ncbi:MAG: response regulator [Rhodospirillales bacterium]|nr:response regulator [Rhodospirillales bacterium]MCB9996739.1 response regulator [Rhodospirillales bacterium]